LFHNGRIAGSDGMGCQAALTAAANAASRPTKGKLLDEKLGQRKQ
jgi:hypothetical protein